MIETQYFTDLDDALKFLKKLQYEHINQGITFKLVVCADKKIAVMEVAWELLIYHMEGNFTEGLKARFRSYDEAKEYLAEYRRNNRVFGYSLRNL